MMKKKKLVEKLIKTANEIQRDKKPKANYIHLTEEFIQKQADKNGISFDMMVETIKNELNPK